MPGSAAMEVSGAAIPAGLSRAVAGAATRPERRPAASSSSLTEPWATGRGTRGEQQAQGEDKKQLPSKAVVYRQDTTCGCRPKAQVQTSHLIVVRRAATTDRSVGLPMHALCMRLASRAHHRRRARCKPIRFRHCPLSRWPWRQADSCRSSVDVPIWPFDRPTASHCTYCNVPFCTVRLSSG